MSVFSRAADLLDAQALDPLGDPVAWADRRLGVHLWSKQRQIIESVRDNRRTVVESCHGAGKSFTAAVITGWWLDSHPPGEAFVVTTAPGFAQVKAILWREIGKMHRKAGLPGRVNQTEWHLGDELVAFGRKPSDYDQSAFQGIHARYVLVIMDEADGIPSQLYTDAGALLTNDDCRLLAIGNPDSTNSHMSTVAAPGSGWVRIGISAFETPNFTGESVPADLLPYLVGQTYVAETLQDFGETSPVYSSKVLGVRPKDDTDGVVPWSAVTACRAERDWLPGSDLPVELGVDFGAGGDMTVIRERRGAHAGRTWKARTPQPGQAVDLILQALDETGATCVKTDVIGIGWGPTGRLEELGRIGRHPAKIVKVNVGAASREPHRFPKLRDELWWMARELSQSGGWDLSRCDDQTINQLCAPKYALDGSGRVKVEKKDETRARIGRSPDDADALCLAFYNPPRPVFLGSA